MYLSVHAYKMTIAYPESVKYLIVISYNLLERGPDTIISLLVNEENTKQ